MSWSVLQSASNVSGPHVATLAAAFGTNLTAGTKLICWLSIGAVDGDPGGTVPADLGVSDGNGHSFTALTAVSGTPFAGYHDGLYPFVLDTPAGDAGTKPTITASWTNAGGCSMLIQEVSGLATGNAGSIDGTWGSSQGSATGSIGPPSYTSAVSGEALFYVYSDNGNNDTATAPAGYTTDSNSVNDSPASDIVVSFKDSTGGTETGSYSLSPNAIGWTLILGAFKLSSTPASANLLMASFP